MIDHSLKGWFVLLLNNNAMAVNSKNASFSLLFTACFYYKRVFINKIDHMDTYQFLEQKNYRTNVKTRKQNSIITAPQKLASYIFCQKPKPMLVYFHNWHFHPNQRHNWNILVNTYSCEKLRVIMSIIKLEKEK